MQLDQSIRQIQNFLLCSAIFELVAYFFQMIYFVGKSNVNATWFVVFSLVHPVRAVCSLLLMRKIPETRDLVKESRMQTHDQVTFQSAT
jgi:hypothetical protein